MVAVSIILMTSRIRAVVGVLTTEDGDTKWSSGGPVDPWSRIRITLMRSRIRIRISIKVVDWIRISVVEP